MPLPQRQLRTIQPVPSIYTTFTTNDNTKKGDEDLGRCLTRQIEEGIEVVPFERSNILSAPILSPDETDKEVFIPSHTIPISPDKPLPKLPQSPWAKLSIRQRMLALLGVQFATLLTVGVILMAVTRRFPTAENNSVRTETSDDDAPDTSILTKILQGPYTVPIQSVQEQSRTCLAQRNESIAWQCASDTAWQIRIIPRSSKSDMDMVTLESLQSMNATIYHGHQAPKISTVSNSSIVSKSENNVYSFTATYDHTVLLKESDLMPIETPKPQSTMLHPSFQLGETIWKCVFRGTQILGYIHTGERIGPSYSYHPGSGDPPKIPFRIELEEKRMPNDKGAYCETYKVKGNDLAPVSGKKVWLSLTEPLGISSEGKLARSVKFWPRQQSQETQFCRCRWTIT